VELRLRVHFARCAEVYDFEEGFGTGVLEKLVFGLQVVAVGDCREDLLEVGGPELLIEALQFRYFSKSSPPHTTPTQY